MAMSNFIPNSNDDAGNNNPGNGNGPGIPGIPGAGTPFSSQQGPSAGGNDDEVLALLIDYNIRYATNAPTLYRDDLIQQTLSVLIGKTKPNALLIGAAGVGKTKIAEDIARRIAIGDALIPDQLKNHTVYELPISNLIAGTGIRGQLEAKVQAVIDFAVDPKNKAILFIDEIHQIAGGSGGSQEGRMIAQILKPALARGDLHVIGATTSQEGRDLDDDPAFVRRFSRLVVDELTAEQTLEVLKAQRHLFIAHYGHQLAISDAVLEDITRIADQHSRAGSHRPDSAITLLDRAMSDRVLDQRQQIASAQLSGNTPLVQALQSMANIPLTTDRVLSVAKRLLTGNAKPHELNAAELRTALFSKLKGQDDVLEQVLERIERESLGLYPRTTPIAMMFAGASGLGKTETAKILAEHVTDQPPIVLNMTEYKTEASLSRIIGSPAGYVGYDSNAELPFDTLESNPHRVILLDEFEKGDPSVQRLFLSALDEGYLKTSRGKTIDFSKAIVIATTNAAREELNPNQTGFTAGPQKITHSSLAKALANHFDAELLGRFSTLIGFNPIDQASFVQIVRAAYIAQRNMVISASAANAAALPDTMPVDAVESILQRSFIQSQGARPAARAVRQWIETRIIAHRSNASAQPAVAVPASTNTD